MEAGVRDLKSFFGVGSALLPILYCAGLLYYFLDLSGSVQEAEEVGLGPTVLGLGVVGLLFSIPLIIRVVRLVGRARARGPGDDEPGSGRTVDADAAIARYKARQAEERDRTPVAPPPRTPAPRSGFGRRNR
ncbi:hypothetical protein GCM10008942_09720 [Rhizomicrobium electricum]|uniref:Uncharacterized protein n=1 Tax=Rhizomicrobium electricum TaxID=480070 RepID=A0ABN1EBZ3_9PROT